MDVIGENTFILVYRDRRRKWIVRPSETPRLHTHLGILDIGDPWEALPSFRRSLRPSGVIAAITPTTNQAERLVEKMKEERFVAVETVEILMRHLEARAGMTRPSNAMVGHTAYLTFGRKTL